MSDVIYNICLKDYRFTYEKITSQYFRILIKKEKRMYFEHCKDWYTTSEFVDSFYGMFPFKDEYGFHDWCWSWLLNKSEIGG